MCGLCRRQGNRRKTQNFSTPLRFKGFLLHSRFHESKNCGFCPWLNNTDRQRKNMAQVHSSLEAAIVVGGSLLLIGGPALWWVFNRMDAPPKPPEGDPLPAGPMRSSDIRKIEVDLGVTLPDCYKMFLSSESPEEVDGTSVMRDASLIISATTDYRTGKFSAPCWPAHFVYIGDEDDACPYALDCNTGEVVETDHGNLKKTPIAKYASFELFISNLTKQ